MPLDAGMQLGPYEIQAPLGAGGMGEVYKARDTRLDRTVAMKVLPAHVAADPDLKQRFEREAKTVAALSHPHICPVFDVGSQDGIDFLVMEYLEGETVAQRLEKGALPLDQALQIAIEIADALDKAHRQGIVHRDLKPGNIMLTKTGAKLLDFGLAKLNPAYGTPMGVSAPTMSAGLTGEGSILGTLQYMAPEQLEGADADARTDIFGLGALVYEMVTGRRAFEGDSQASLISTIMSSTPAPVSSIQRVSPAPLDHLVEVCLAKAPEDRWQTARDVLRELQWIAQGAPQVAAETPPRSAPGSRWLPWALVGALGALSVFTYFDAAPPDMREFRLEIATPPTDDPISLAISPDGTQVVFVARYEGTNQLWLRALDSTSARPLLGTDGASTPFWSPDSRSVGFAASEQLKRLDLAGGTVQSLGDLVGGAGSGASWGVNDEILFGDLGGIFSMPASGGDRTLVIPAGEGSLTHRFPTFLPGGTQFLYWVQGPSDAAAVYVGSIDGAPPKRLLTAHGGAVYVHDGYLAFVRQRTLYLQRFDLERLEMAGEPTELGQVAVNFWGQSAVSASQDGTLVYRGGAAGTSELAWFDRAGDALSVPFSEPLIFAAEPALSPTGEHAAFTRVDVGGSADVWLLDEARGGGQRLSLDPLDDYWPGWSPDGTRVAFGSNRTSPAQVYAMPSNRSSPAEQLWASVEHILPADWSPDGDAFLYQTRSASETGSTGYDLWAQRLGTDEPIAVANTPFHETRGQFSPDGRWVAYQSDESGRSEIHVRAFPGPGSQQQVSSGGGGQPRWGADGRELFYVSLDSNLMVIELEATQDGRSLQTSPPRLLFRTRITGGGELSLGFKQMYDVAPNGQRFLMAVVPEQATISPLTVLLNWRRGTSERAR